MEINLSFPVLVSLLLGILVPLFYFLYLFIKTRKHGEEYPLPTPPGKTGLPLIGETLDFLAVARKVVPERFTFDRMKKYSSMVFKTSLIGHPMVLLCGPEGNKFVFSNENKLVKSWWPPSVGAIFHASTESNSRDNSSSEKVMEIRDFISPYFKPEAIQKYFEIMESVTKHHLQQWEGKDVIAAFPLVKRYTFSLACRLFLGIEDEETVKRLKKPYDQVLAAFYSMPVNFPGTSYNRALKASVELKREFDGLIKRWKSDFSQGRLSASQKVLEQVLQEAFEDDNISTKMLGLLASHDSTSSTMVATIMYMAKHPHVYDKVLKEQLDIASSKKAQEILNWGDIQKMKYTWNVVCEALRLNPQGCGTFREFTSDFVYNGYFIPKGWKIHWNAYGTHRNPEYFKDPNKFDPSRFEGDGPIIPYSYVPFGGGPHMCPGREYAKINILILMHVLVTKFRWKMACPNEKIVYTC